MVIKKSVILFTVPIIDLSKQFSPHHNVLFHSLPPYKTLQTGRKIDSVSTLTAEARHKELPNYDQRKLTK